MVINLQTHGLDKRSRLGGNALDTLTSYLKSSIGEVAGDKGVQARVVAGAITSVTGIAPVIDASDPKVTWVRTVPAHADWMESVFVKSIAKNPNARPADLKIDIMPALKPILLKRFLPVLGLIGAGVFAVGYFVGRK